MASNFITYTKHGVAESTLLKATKVGHHYNLVNESKDIDNGSVAVIGDRKRADVFEAKVPAKGDKIVLILTAPKIYQEYETRMQEESNFYNGKGEVMRAYEIQDTDRFTLSTEAFNSDAELAVFELSERRKYKWLIRRKLQLLLPQKQRQKMQRLKKIQ